VPRDCNLWFKTSGGGASPSFLSSVVRRVPRSIYGTRPGATVAAVGRLALVAEERHYPISLDDLRKAVAHLKAEGFTDTRTLATQQATHSGQSNLPEKVFLVIGNRFCYELVHHGQNWYAVL
jgi:hypothetical protein